MPGTECGKQFHITIAEPFSFTNQPITPVDKGKADVPGDGAPYGIGKLCRNDVQMKKGVRPTVTDR